MKYRIFISSVQREFAKERRAIADYIRRDALFGKFFDVFIFEETPAANVPANVPANGTMDGTINGTLALRIVSVLEESPSTTLDQLAKRLNVARRSLVRYMNILQHNNRIRRVGGKRFGHWEVLVL